MYPLHPRVLEVCSRVLLLSVSTCLYCYGCLPFLSCCLCLRSVSALPGLRQHQKLSPLVCLSPYMMLVLKTTTLILSICAIAFKSGADVIENSVFLKQTSYSHEIIGIQ